MAFRESGSQSGQPLRRECGVSHAAVELCAAGAAFGSAAVTLAASSAASPFPGINRKL